MRLAGLLSAAHTGSMIGEIDPSQGGLSKRGKRCGSMKAGFVYFALVFALGFLLGTLRTQVAPAIPESARLLAVIIELPIMLAASWFFCGFVIRRFAVPPAARSRSLMGGVAFILLMLAEFLIGAVMLGHSLGEHLTLYKDASYAIGLAAQVAFALMPWMYTVFERDPGTPA